MYKADQIADYIVARCIDTSCPISNLQLNKIMYFVQKDFLSDSTDGLIEEDFEAWQYGPVMPQVYSKYWAFGGMYILLRPLNIIELPLKIKARIDNIVDEKKLLSPWALVAETHKKGGAWDFVYRNGAGNHNIITKQIIKERDC